MHPETCLRCLGDDERTGLGEGTLAPGREVAGQLPGAEHRDAGSNGAVASGWRSAVH